MVGASTVETPQYDTAGRRNLVRFHRICVHYSAGIRYSGTSTARHSTGRSNPILGQHLRIRGSIGDRFDEMAAVGRNLGIYGTDRSFGRLGYDIFDGLHLLSCSLDKFDASVSVGYPRFHVVGYFWVSES